MSLLAQIGAFCRQHNMKPTVFGRTVLRDPRFVGDLRQGREPRPATVKRVQDYLRTGGRA